MGCSASRPSSFHNKTSSEDPSIFSNYSSSSPSFTCSSRALSFPTPLVHHPPLRKGDTNHLVSLTSTTYGSLLLIDPQIHKNHNFTPPPSPPPAGKPRAPADSLSPDSVINTWELMDGLDDDDDDREERLKLKKAATFHIPAASIPAPAKPSSFRCLGSNGSAKKPPSGGDSPPPSKPLWQHLSEEALLAKMDPNVAASYRRALSSRQLSYDNPKSPVRVPAPDPPKFTKSETSLSLPEKEKEKETKIVVYFTSLRGIRKTYEDCCSVQMIFRGFRVLVDERDISMDSAYRKELQDLLGGKTTLPQVFIGKNHIGGADEIRQLNEAGELTKLLKGCPVRDPEFVCKTCGDARFVPCPNCCGSRKIFEEEEGQLRRCPDCNENGLIRCPGCCS